MGNANNSMQRERHKSAVDSTPNSPFREMPQRRESTGGSGTVSSHSARHTIGGSSGAVVGQAFTYDKKRDSVLGSSQEDDEPYYTTKSTISSNKVKSAAATPTENDSTTVPRRRSSTISEGTIPKANVQMSAKDDDSKSDEAAAVTESDRNPALPTVLRWDGGGHNVMISGTFTKWKPIPMVRSHGNFVTIIDLPEGDHQYKFYVDGVWKHDPKLASIITYSFYFVLFICNVCYAMMQRKKIDKFA